MSAIETREIRHFHLACGIGGGAKGFNKGHARVGNMQARFRCLGGIDVDPNAAKDFERLAGVPCTVLDLFSREQYAAFHGREPPPGWQPAMPDDLRRASGFEHPHIVFASFPCKGFSGLLPEKTSKSAKYQALNGLTFRGLWLLLEAWAHDPVELIVFENVPRIQNRGRGFLDQIGALLRAYGYAVAETTHDCGKIGNLAQSRKRFLLVARHMEKVPPFLYQPATRRLRGVGEVLEHLPLPGAPAGGPMHRIPRLQWKTWVRLAFVEAGKDWRSLQNLRVDGGVLTDFGIVPECTWQNGVLGVHRWNDHAGVITGRGSPTTGKFSVADPRFEGLGYGQYGVRRWNDSTGVVTGQRSPGQGAFAVADPRGSENNHASKYRVTRMTEPAGAVIAASTTGQGAFAVADPRPLSFQSGRAAYASAGHYGVVGWKSPSYAITAAGQHDNGRFSVADPRPTEGEPLDGLPMPDAQMVAVIRSLDDTWHRPFTTLEEAALQGLIEAEEYTELSGLSDSAWRERIGNAVPPPAAQAIASVMGRTLLLAWSGEGFFLSSEPIWVRPIALALSVDSVSRPDGD